MNNWPRLSTTLPHLHDPRYCGNCGTGEKVTLWIEHDDNDQPELKFVALCLDCADKIIEPHPRLYAGMQQNAPFPGAMAICLDCTKRTGLRCASPLAKFNGGAGINISAPRPVTAFMDGTRKGPDGRRRRTGWVERFYPSAPTACTGRTITPQ